MLRRLAACLTLALALAGCDHSHGDHDHGAAAGNLYVMNQGEASVSVLDPATGALVKTIRLPSLGFSASAQPHFAAFEPDGSAWYLTLIGDNKVVKFDANDAVLAQATTNQPA